MITSVVLPYQVYVLTGDILAVGALSLIQLFPIMIFALGGGAVADAVDRRKLLLLTQLGLAACSLAFVGIALMPSPSIPAIYVVAFAAAGIGAIDQPARASAIPRLVPVERLPAAIGLNQLVFNGAAVIGPAIGGILLATAGVATAYMIDVVTFGAAIVALLLIAPIRPSPGAVRPSIAAVVEGLRFARRRREVLATFIVDLNAMVFGSPRSLYPALALDVFMVGPAGVGLMASASAFGALVGAHLQRLDDDRPPPGPGRADRGRGLGPRHRRVRALDLQLPARAAVPRDRRGADVISAVLRSSIVQILTPDSLRGRVSSIHILIVTGGPRIGDAEASAVASVIGDGGVGGVGRAPDARRARRHRLRDARVRAARHADRDGRLGGGRPRRELTRRPRPQRRRVLRPGGRADGAATRLPRSRQAVATLPPALAASLTTSAASSLTGADLTSSAPMQVVRDLVDLLELHERDDPRRAGGEHRRQVTRRGVPRVEVAELPDGGATRADDQRRRDDRRREDDPGDHAGDRADREALAGVVVGHLDDVDLALGVRVGDEHALDVEVARLLGIDDQLVGRAWPRRRRRTAPRRSRCHPRRRSRPRR